MTSTSMTNNACFQGRPSDEVDAILATGRGGITTLFASMAARHPDGHDSDYLQWHALDHRPEQYRLASIKSSLRVISTPECRSLRAASSEGFDAVDHVMVYFFSHPDGLAEFAALSTALRDAGRSPFVLPPVQRGVFDVQDKLASSQAKVGADVLPWLPIRGIYLLLEEGEAVSAAPLIEIEGITGIWTASARGSEFSSLPQGQHFTMCFLGDDPLKIAQLLESTLLARWQSQQTRALLAAPFYTVVPYEWDKHLP